MSAPVEYVRVSYILATDAGSGPATSPAVLVEPTPEAVADRAAALLPELLGDGPAPVLGAATGATPLPLYRRLARHWTPPPALRLVLLDEYAGLPPGHPASFRAAVDRWLAGPLGVPAHRLHGPDASATDAEDLARAARAYEATLVRLGGVDVQVLGIGANGHIGFCEPGTPFDSATHVATLADRTRADAAGGFDRPDDVPRRAVTQGIATILRARALLLLATGAGKAPALAAALAGPLDPAVPASALRLHPRAVVLADRAAAHLLP